MNSKLFTNIDDSFTASLPGDPNNTNSIRQVLGAAYSFVDPTPSSNPSLIHVSPEMVTDLGLTMEQTSSSEFLKIFSGSTIHEGTKPYAMAYGGHQFGHWAGQLGDGRAINLFEVVHNKKRWALQLKGAGLTPYSRSADGLAVLRSSIREYMCSEAMYHLGVPTTRALSLVLSGDQVMRDMLYDGNPALEKGAIVCRVAPSFIRFGNFQIFAARRDQDNLKKLADYTISHFYPDIDPDDSERYIQFFQKVTERTLNMIIHWQRVGFVHGVMNTDNMSILGLTIDYGPYGWSDNYDTEWTPNTTDRQNRRYRFGQQPNIALWNLGQLANTLFPLVQKQEPFIEVLEWYKSNFAKQYFEMMGSKLGLMNVLAEDHKLITRLENLLLAAETDMTIFFRKLASYSSLDIEDNRRHLDSSEMTPIRQPSGTEFHLLEPISDAFYQPDEITDDLKSQWADWIQEYRLRLKLSSQSPEERKEAMNKVNPKYVLRNYMAQEIIDAADQGNYSLLEEVFEMLKKPYDEQPQYERWFVKRPDWARNKVGCSMLSCSS